MVSPPFSCDPISVLVLPRSVRVKFIRVKRLPLRIHLHLNREVKLRV